MEKAHLVTFAALDTHDQASKNITQFDAEVRSATATSLRLHEGAATCAKWDYVKLRHDPFHEGLLARDVTKVVVRKGLCNMFGVLSEESDRRSNLAGDDARQI